MFGATRLESPGQAEVDDFQPAGAGDHHVGRFQVAVDDAAIVGVGERVRCLDAVPKRFVHRQRRAFRHRWAVDVLHRDERALAVRSDLVARTDVRMIECGRRLRLLDETSAASLVRQTIDGQHFDGDFAPQPRVLGLVDFTHAPGAERAKELVWAEPHADGKGHGQDFSREYTPEHRARVRATSLPHPPPLPPPPRRLTDGSLTENLNKTGVRLWT